MNAKNDTITSAGEASIYVLMGSGTFLGLSTLEELEMYHSPGVCALVKVNAGGTAHARPLLRGAESRSRETNVPEGLKEYQIAFCEKEYSLRS